MPNRRKYEYDLVLKAQALEYPVAMPLTVDQVQEQAGIVPTNGYMWLVAYPTGFTVTQSIPAHDIEGQGIESLNTLAVNRSLEFYSGMWPADRHGARRLIPVESWRYYVYTRWINGNSGAFHLFAYAQPDPRHVTYDNEYGACGRLVTTHDRIRTDHISRHEACSICWGISERLITG